MFQKISKLSVYILVFILPLFFLPFTASALEFQKQALLFFLAAIALVLWLAHILTTYKLEINRSPVNLPVIILVVLTLLSTLFSAFRYGSFWGFPLPLASSFLTLLLFAILYFLISNLFKKEEIPFLFLALFASGFLASLFFVFQVFGKFLLPFDFARANSFNTIGTVNSLAIYLALLLILMIPSLLLAKRSFKIILGSFGAVFLFSLFLINFKPAWLVFLAGIAVLFALGTIGYRGVKGGLRDDKGELGGVKGGLRDDKGELGGVKGGLRDDKGELGAKEGLRDAKGGLRDAKGNLRGKAGLLWRPGFVTLLMAFLIIGIFFTFSQFSLPWTPQLPFEIGPSHKASFNIFTKLSAANIIFGTGPGTFSYSWSKQKPAEMNQTLLWSIRFSQPSSEILDKVIGTGILGLLAFFFLAWACLRAVFKDLLTESGLLDRFLLWASFASLVAFVAAFLLYPANISILFLFWVLVGVASLLGQKERKTFDLQVSSLSAMITSFSAVLILILVVGLAILYGQKYSAEVRYLQGLKAFDAGNIEKSTDYILRAANLNPKIDIYWRDLSQIFLFELQGLLNRTDLSQEEMAARAQGLIADSVNSASQATAVDQKNAANWNIRGFVYRNVIGILGGAENWALVSYEKARELEPKSPYILTEIARVYLLTSDFLGSQEKTEEQKEAFDLARESLDKAIELKPDYAPAHFQMAMLHIREDKIAQAIERLETTKAVAPFDTGLAFQLGLIYYSNNQLREAKAELERAVLLDPDYSNARYFLGLIHDKEGGKKAAIDQFVKIEELNPQNQEIKKILANLRAGKPALEGVVPGEPPIEERLEEQLE